MDKLKSRKLWLALIGAALVVFNDQFGWGFSTDTLNKLVELVLGYIIVEGVADVASRLKK